MKKTSKRTSREHRGRSYKEISESISRGNYLQSLANGDVMFSDRPGMNKTVTSLMKRVKKQASSNISWEQYT